MTVVSLIIGIIAYIVYKKCYDKYIYSFSNTKKYIYRDISNICETICWVMIFIAGILFTIGIIMFGLGAYAKMSIPIYEEENAKIEEQVSEFVSKYTDYEKDTFKELKPETMQIMIMTYPELKTNELVKKQIDVYVSNNEKLKKLKEDCNQYKIGKWLLYFG